MVNTYIAREFEDGMLCVMFTASAENLSKLS
jgi:hypothetical protein